MSNITKGNSLDSRSGFDLWNEFLEECENLVGGEHEWETVKLKGHHTKQEQKVLINELFIKKATLPQIVRRHLYNRHNINIMY